MKITVGTLVQWYEVDILNEFVETLIDAHEYKDDSIDVVYDFTVYLGQRLEQIEEGKTIASIQHKIAEIVNKLHTISEVELRFTDELTTISDYRRTFNETYCTKADVLFWGETDMLFPMQGFELIANLHSNAGVAKYLAFFGCCKMWDDSWKPIEHVDFTDKPFIENDYDNWWSVKYTMNKDEMNQINDKVEDVQIIALNQHKFNGCGLVIPSEVIKAGVNIPQSVFFVHEDTSFQLMTQKVLGNIPQFVFKNILLVHNRNHPDKRKYVKGESGDTMNKRRRSNEWYVKANKMSEQNCYNLFNPNYKSFTWDDVFIN